MQLQLLINTLVSSAVWASRTRCTAWLATASFQIGLPTNTQYRNASSSTCTRNTTARTKSKTGRNSSLMPVSILYRDRFAGVKPTYGVFSDHCLESLRQILLCQPDISIYTLQWTPHNRVKPTVRVLQEHACVDWSSLHAWMLERAAKLEDVVPPDPFV